MVGFISWGRKNYLCKSSSADLIDLLCEAFIFGVVVTMC